MMDRLDPAPSYVVKESRGDCRGLVHLHSLLLEGLDQHQRDPRDGFTMPYDALVAAVFLVKFQRPIQVPLAHSNPLLRRSVPRFLRAPGWTPRACSSSCRPRAV